MAAIVLKEAAIISSSRGLNAPWSANLHLICKADYNDHCLFPYKHRSRAKTKLITDRLQHTLESKVTNKQDGSRKGKNTRKEGGRTGIAAAEKLLEQRKCQPGKQSEAQHDWHLELHEPIRVPCLPSHRNYLCVLWLLQTQWNSAPHKHSWASEPSHMDSHPWRPMS